MRKSKNIGLVGAVLTSAAMTFYSPYSYCADSASPANPAKDVNTTRTSGAKSPTKLEDTNSDDLGGDAVDQMKLLFELMKYLTPEEEEQKAIAFFEDEHPRLLVKNKYTYADEIKKAKSEGFNVGYSSGLVTATTLGSFFGGLLLAGTYFYYRKKKKANIDKKYFS